MDTPKLMKKIVAIAPVLLVAALLSGCGLFHTSKPWQSAKQENPLEIPPNMDRPDVSDALTIPRVNAQSEEADSASSAPSSAMPTNKVHLKGNVGKAYKRVGLALGNGDIGDVIAQSELTHTYQVAMKSKLDVGAKKGFFARHFSNTQDQPGRDSADAASTTGARGSTVTVQVTAAAEGGSTVTAQGDPKQVSQLMDALKARLGAN
jgi:uncharacterized lipoprotein